MFVGLLVCWFVGWLVGWWEIRISFVRLCTLPNFAIFLCSRIYTGFTPDLHRIYTGCHIANHQNSYFTQPGIFH